MGVVAKAGLLITAGYKDFDKADEKFKSIKRAALAAQTFVNAAKGGNTLIDQAKPISKQQRDIESNISRMTRLQHVANATGKAIASTSGWIKAIAGIGAYFGIDKIVAGFNDWTDSMYESQRAAAKLGMTTGELMRFNFGLQAIGVNADDSVKALNKVYDTFNRAKIGDVTAKRLLSPEVAGKGKFFGSERELTNVRDVEIGTNAEQTFAQVRSGIKELDDNSMKAARMLMVLGDDAFNVANAFVKSKDGIEAEAKKRAGLIFGNKDDMDNKIDRLKDSLTVFNAVATDFKIAFMTVGVEYMQFFTRMINSAIKGAADKGISVADFAEGTVNLVYSGLLNAVNIGVDIAKNVNLINQNIKMLLNLNAKVAQRELPYDIPDPAKSLQEINDFWEKKKINVDPNGIKMFGDTKGFMGIQEAGRKLMGYMNAIKPLTDKAHDIIAQNKSPREELMEGLKALNLSKDFIPQDIYGREFAKLVNKAEASTAVATLNMPSANRMFSVDTESLVNRINMERDIKGRDPMQRLVDAMMQTLQQDKERNDLLKGVKSAIEQQFEQLIWGK